jgi:hypothetical protein
MRLPGAGRGPRAGEMEPKFQSSSSHGRGTVKYERTLLEGRQSELERQSSAVSILHSLEASERAERSGRKVRESERERNGGQLGEGDH